MKKILQHLAAALLIVFLSVSLVSGADDQNQHSAIEQHLLKGDYGKASQLLTKWNPVDEQSRQAKSLLQLRLALSQGDYGKVIEFFDNSEHKPLLKMSPFLVLLVEAMLAKGQVKEALQLLMAEIREHPDNWGAHLRLIRCAEILQNRSLLKREERLFMRLYANRKLKNAEALTAAARASEAADPAGAWKVYQEAQLKDKSFLYACLLAGNHALNRFAFSKAGKEYGKVLAQNPKHCDALFGIAQIAATNCQHRQALNQLEKILAVNPNHVGALDLKAKILIFTKEREQALASLENASKVWPDSPDTLSSLAAFYEIYNQPVKRDEVIASYKTLYPKQPDIYFVLSELCEKKYRFKEAIDWADKGVAVDPSRWEGFFLGGINRLRLGDDKEGYALLKKSFVMNKFNTVAYNTLLALDREFLSGDFVLLETKHFAVKMTKADKEKLWKDMGPYLEDIYQRYTKKYEFEPVGADAYGKRILLLVLPTQASFSARTVGIPAINAAGVCFGKVITMPSPANIDSFIRDHSWRAIVAHEFLHVITLQKSRNRIPRWFTEAISTWEEQTLLKKEHVRLLQQTSARKRLLKIEDLEKGFVCTEYPGQIFISYLQAKLACAYLESIVGIEGIKAILDGYRQGQETRDILEKVTKRDLKTLNKEIFQYIEQTISEHNKLFEYMNKNKKPSGW